MLRWLYEFRRVLRVARKPPREEYTLVSKVTGLGTLLIGFIGFLIMVISYFVGGMVGA